LWLNNGLKLKVFSTDTNTICRASKKRCTNINFFKKKSKTLISVEHLLRSCLQMSYQLTRKVNPKYLHYGIIAFG
jgi:hypothetical protein